MALLFFYTGSLHVSLNESFLLLYAIYANVCILFAAMYQAGMGPSHVNTFLAALEVPGMQYNALKKREEEVSQAIKSVAEASCLHVLQQECTLSDIHR